MRHNKKWHIVFLLACIIVMVSSCDTKGSTPPTTPSAQATDDTEIDESSVYNNAFESYSDMTELGVIINNPTPEDLNKISNLETYGKADQGTSMLIIPKYKNSKITVSKAEYTGEQYIAKEELFSNDATPPDYGLQLYANRPEGIPELIITINYQKVNCRYIVSSNGKSGNQDIEILKVENTDVVDGKGEMLPPIVDSTYVNGLNLFSSSEVDIDGDGKSETLEVYCDATIDDKGQQLLDDGQTWTMILRKGNAFYPLFDKAYIQLGNLQYTIYEDYNDYNRMHILIEYKTGAAIYLYDCVYDAKSGNIQKNNFFQVDNINLIQSWQ